MKRKSVNKEIVVQVNSDGIVVGGNYHDARVKSVEQNESHEIKISYISTDESTVELLLRNVSAGNIGLNANDIITDIFYWKKPYLAKLHDGVWAEILEYFVSKRCKKSILQELSSDNGLLLINCATQGGGAVIVDSFLFLKLQHGEEDCFSGRAGE